MKYLKRILYLIISILIILLIISFVAIKIEKNQLSYLKIKSQSILSNNSYIIKNVNLIPMTKDTVLMNRNVRIEDGIIKNVDEKIIDDNKEVIDGKGMFLSPGLIDMHVHVWDRFELGLYLANGVTTVRNLIGIPFHLDIKNEINNNELIGPLFYTSTPAFSGIEDKDILKKPIKSPEEAKKLIIKYKNQGYDYIKTYNLLHKDVFDAVLEQSLDSKMPVVSHPSFKVNYNYHFNSTISTIEHTEDIYQQPLNYTFDNDKLKSVIKGYVESNQTHSPTLTVFYNLTEIYNKGEKVLTSEGSKYINPFIKSASSDYSTHMSIKTNDSSSTKRINDQHNFHIEIIKKLHESKVNIVCGTDAGILNTPAGFSIHKELSLYQQAGLSNYEALKTATINPTKVYEEYKKFGTIENEKIANFILSVKNPLSDLSTLKSPELVMVKGRVIDKQLMEEFKQKAYERNNYIASLTRIVKYILWEK